MAPSARRRRLRWSAPFATAAVIAVIVAVPGLSAAGTPTLPALTPAQLLAKVHQANVGDLSGTINLSTNLGIPNLSALTDAAGGGGHGRAAFSPTDLLAGTHQARVWFAAPDSARIALLGDMAETDVVHRGHDIWTWDSATKKVVHYTVVAQSGAPASARAAAPAEPIQTPQQLANDLLAHISPTTSVSVGAPVTVARQKAYQLILAPHSGASTVDHVVIAVDRVTGLPLQVQIFAKGQKAAAVKVGFGDISYATPAASRFAFTAPPGATVTDKTAGATHDSAGAAQPADDSKTNAGSKSGQPVTVGQDWSSVTILSGVQIPKQLNQYLMAGSVVNTAAGRGRLLSSSLVNVLVLDDGRVAVGAVNRSALVAAIASAH